MNNVNENDDIQVKMIKHFIKDLSFENPQDVNFNNAENNNNHDISTNMKVIYEPYKNNFFSLLFKYTFDCSSKKNKEKLCYLELDYFGFFKIEKNKEDNQKALTEAGLNFIFPFAKEVIENISLKGGSVPIILDDLNINLIED